MKKIKDNKAASFDVEQSVYHRDQRGKNRRKQACEGYAYISTVGWICRRERFRRKGTARPQ